MNYKVRELAENYAKSFMENEISIESFPVPTFNTHAYNDYEYLSCIQELNETFDKIDALHITEKFLKGE